MEPGDTVYATLKKEFGEEAMDTLQMDKEKKKTEEAISNLFKGGEKVGNPLLSKGTSFSCILC